MIHYRFVFLALSRHSRIVLQHHRTQTRCPQAFVRFNQIFLDPDVHLKDITWVFSCSLIIHLWIDSVCCELLPEDSLIHSEIFVLQFGAIYVEEYDLVLSEECVIEIGIRNHVK